MNTRINVLVAALLAAAAPALAARTIVTLGFDDSTENQMTAVQLLNQRGLKGTFYVISGLIGTSNGFYMSRADLDAIAAAGHEIAGHTLTHPDLTTVSLTQVQQEICDGRTQLQSWGFNPISFAYPFGSYNASVESVAKSCYANARTVGGVNCPGCPNSETTPPQDAWAIRSPDSLQSDTSLAAIEKLVTDAENSGGGWVPLVIHQICDGCNTYSMSAATLSSFLDWLTPRSGLGTVVQTNAQVMGGTPPPPPPPNPAPSISSLSPASAAAGSAAFTLTVKGSGFAAVSSVRWNGQARATTVVDAATLRASILPGDLALPAAAKVTVFTPAPGGGTSASQDFTVAVPPNPIPSIAGVTPSTATAGDPGFRLAVVGSNFLKSSVAIVNGQNRSASFVSASRLDVPILKEDLSSPTTVTLTVANPAPGGGASTARIVVLQQPGAAPAAPGGGLRIFPNPWRVDQHRGLDVTVDGLNPGSEVRFFTVSGRWVRTISTVNGAGKWDLTNDSGQRVASGVYLFVATDPAGGDQHGTLAIVE